MSKSVKKFAKWLFGLCVFICFFAYTGVPDTKADDSIPLAGMTLKNATVYEGKTLTIKPIVTPAAAALPELVFSSSNKKVATVSKTGAVKALTKGSTTITVVASGTSVRAKCVVTVKRLYISRILLKASRITVNRGELYALKKGVSPSGATYQKIQWTSSNRRIVDVNGTGTIKGIRNGKATITAKALDGSNKVSRCVITVRRHSINVKSATMRKDTSARLRIIGARSKIKWASSNRSIAYVDQNGIVRARKKGTCTIAAKVGSEKYTCRISVRNPYTPQIAALHSGGSKTSSTNKIQFGITNYGNYTLKIESVGYYISGSDYVVKVKELSLRNSSGRRINSLNVGSKKAVSVYYVTKDGKRVGLNAKTKVQFYFTYDGVKYACVTDGNGNATYTRR